MLVTSIVLLGGYVLWRGRHRYDGVKDGVEFERSPATRHLVAMRHRVDRDTLKSWLEEKEGAGAGGAGGGAAREGEGLEELARGLEEAGKTMR